ncbi:hypothetical protein RF11_13120 [Thelohanellus kitauei]|uniref:Uncharacterized protein n=1 Tax=Thelohanellus kitauei TaxID=669202 RepID=A0A0C2JV11_THEKT|nr:hypothetical protein RF11_13120 [Thelohanellus kitauei]
MLHKFFLWAISPRMIIYRTKISNIVKKCSNFNEDRFKDIFDSLEQDQKQELSWIFSTDLATEKITISDQNITNRRSKTTREESEADLVRKSILKGLYGPRNTSNLAHPHINSDLAKILFLEIKENMYNYSGQSKTEFLYILSYFLSNLPDFLVENISPILDIVAFYIEKDQEAFQEFSSILDGLISIMSVSKIISFINPKLSVLSPVECLGMLMILKSLLEKHDVLSGDVSEMIEILPKLLKLWMGNAPSLSKSSRDCLTKIYAILGHDRFNLCTLSLPSEKKLSLFEHFSKNCIVKL